MAKFAVALTALFAFFTLTARAEPVLQSYLLPAADPGDLRMLSRLFDLEHPRDGGFEVQVPAEQAPLLLALAPSAKLVDADVSATIRARLQRYSVTASGGAGYHSFEQVQAWMQAHATTERELVTTIEYGVSRGGRKLTALHVGTARSAGMPVVMITAATHGDELITTEVLMTLVDKLIAGYGHDERLTRLVDSHDLYFVPVVNADGFVATNRYDGSADPNRSYPWPGHDNARPTPSIAAIMQLFAGLDVKGSIDFHAYGEMIMYPWAYTHDPIDSVHKAKFDALTRRMAETNGYAHGSIADVIYIAQGSSADYYFWKKGSASLGIEMGNDKVPSPSEFPDYVRSQEESTWRFIEGI